MNKVVLFFIAFASSHLAQAEKIGILPKDCGPLGREEYGVVFYIEVDEKRVTYFMKGGASEVCPKLLTGKMISGFEKELPKENPLFTEREIKLIREFVVLNYGS